VEGLLLIDTGCWTYYRMAGGFFSSSSSKKGYISTLHWNDPANDTPKPFSGPTEGSVRRNPIIDVKRRRTRRESLRVRAVYKSRSPPRPLQHRCEDDVSGRDPCKTGNKQK